MNIFTKILTTIVALWLLSGCSKEIDIYNKPAMFWFNSMIDSIADNDLEKADDYYTSLQSEHASSPLLPQATNILAQAHMYNEEYLLAEHFINDYIKRYATPAEREFGEYLKIKAKYLALPNARRDQGLISEAIRQADLFKLTYPRSQYYYVIDTMVTRLYLAEASMNQAIVGLYERLDKPVAAEYYKNIKPQPWIDWSRVESPDVPFYKEWFEGDGSSSWYGFMIPNTQSVVSQQVINEEDLVIDIEETQEEDAAHGVYGSEGSYDPQDGEYTQVGDEPSPDGGVEEYKESEMQTPIDENDEMVDEDVQNNIGDSGLQQYENRRMPSPMDNNMMNGNGGI
ncbi:MAG: outer membrane protein assembly factor BamD [Campylobacterota bacterium]|nr:outer membrane protein assembly factor BamD [Campylobacterota bacterium]